MKNLILMATLSFSQLLWADGVLLVTDIDDTIKVSHVLDKDSAAANAFAVKNAFMGMPELYQALTKVESATPMYYLSNAPKKLMTQSHEAFVKINNFPQGVLVLNHRLIERTHKIKSLRQMIKEHEPKVMILIGDNGERDAEVYAQIREEYPLIGGETYIHQTYSQKGYRGQFGKPLLKNQIPWVTSIDLAQDLLRKGYISQDDYLKVVDAVEKRGLAEDPYVERNQQMLFPAWFDCRDFKVPMMEAVSVDFQTFAEKRCAREPYRN